ncbi:aldo/keto reductase [Chloroflexota bacterium]
MEYRRLGNSGLRISEIGLGCNSFGMRTDEASSVNIVQQALETGINFFDTAELYGQGLSETYVGKALKGKRSEVIIATKTGHPVVTGPNVQGGSRHYILKSLEASLKRLQTDYVDLFYIHFPDDRTPILETLRTMDNIVRSGKARYIACSNYAAWQLAEAMWTSKMHNLESFVVNQPRYNMLDRAVEAEIIPCCRAYGVGIIPWGPLAGGFLTGKYRRGVPLPKDSRLETATALYGVVATDENYSRVEKLEAFAAERGHTIGELAIAWLLANPVVSSVIPGAMSPEQVTANAAGANWRLTAEEMAEIDKLLG